MEKIRINDVFKCSSDTDENIFIIKNLHYYINRQRQRKHSVSVRVSAPAPAPAPMPAPAPAPAPMPASMPAPALCRRLRNHLQIV